MSTSTHDSAPRDPKDLLPSEMGEEGVGLTLALERATMAALEAGDLTEAVRLVTPLHYADVADLIERLDTPGREALIAALGADLNPDTLTELDDTVRDAVIAHLGYENFAAMVRQMESDDAVHVVAQLEAEERDRVLEALPPADRAVVEQGLAFPEHSAGRLMRREVVAVPAYWSVGETIDYLRRARHLPEDFYNLFVVDPRHRPVGTISLSRLLRSDRPTRLADIQEPTHFTVPVTMGQEDLAFLFRQHDLLSTAVVDRAGRLLGTITVDDVVDVIDAEAEDDMMRLGGVAEWDFYDAVTDTFRIRVGWLVVNLATAVLASLVIGLFEGTLEHAVALAVLMPIVASMGGNAGTQTLTVAVRALATRELTATNAPRLLGKEMVVALLNGALLALLTGAVAWLWFGSVMIGVTIALALVVTLLVAGLAGLLIPLALERLRIDPAVSSGVFLTTVTDVVGFFTFLGLAALLVL